ncbi:MAG: hypothetical protein JWM81_713 [Candidatus Saccharibacteria bacterium]|nr:hypothetical protein [Candidatus Saccharibacteria bacterium]
MIPADTFEGYPASVEDAVKALEHAVKDVKQERLKAAAGTDNDLETARKRMIWAGENVIELENTPPSPLSE